MSKQVIDQIALECLSIETLETRNSDDLDFKTLSVWEIQRALETAYNAGVDSHFKPKETNPVVGRYRTLVTTRSGNLIYGTFSELTEQQLDDLKSFNTNIKFMDYIHLTDEHGDHHTIHPDDISLITIEKSRA